MLYQIEHYQNQTKRTPFIEWLEVLQNAQAKNCILRRINRLELGNFGDCKPCRNGVWELRIDVGPGYRVYYARSGKQIIVLLCAGDKKNQSADISRACDYWRDWQEG